MKPETGSFGEDPSLSDAERVEQKIKQENAIFLSQDVSEAGMYFDFLARFEDFFTKQCRVVAGKLPPDEDIFNTEKYRHWFNNSPIAIPSFFNAPEAVRTKIGSLMAAKFVTNYEIQDVGWPGTSLLSREGSKGAVEAIDAHRLIASSMQELTDRLNGDLDLVKQLQQMSTEEYINWLIEQNLIPETSSSVDIPQRSKTFEDMLHKLTALLSAKVPNFIDAAEYGSNSSFSLSYDRPILKDGEQAGSLRLSASKQSGGGIVLTLDHPTSGIVKIIGGSPVGRWVPYDEFAEKVDTELQPALDEVFSNAD